MEFRNADDIVRGTATANVNDATRTTDDVANTPANTPPETASPSGAHSASGVADNVDEVARATNTTADATKSASASEGAYASSLTQRTDLIRTLDKTETRAGLRNFVNSQNPITDGGLDAPLTELVNGEIARMYTDEIHYLDIYSNGTGKWNTNTSKGLWTSITFPNSDTPGHIDYFIQTIETALKHEKASIPIGHSGHPGHVFALIKMETNGQS